MQDYPVIVGPSLGIHELIQLEDGSGNDEPVCNGLTPGLCSGRFRLAFTGSVA